MTIQNINAFDDLLETTIKNHDKIKNNIQELYTFATEHAINSGDWSLLARLFVKLLENKICSPIHLGNVLKATNDGLFFSLQKERIKQKETFDKIKTQVVQFWQYTETKKQIQKAFDDVKLLESLKNIVKKAIKNNIESDKIKNAFGLAVAEIK